MAFLRAARCLPPRPLAGLLLLVALAGPGLARARDVVAIPAAVLSHAEGSVAVAAAGDPEWHDVQPRRAVRRGDRIWTDPGSRAELLAASHAIRLDGRTRLAIADATGSATQLSLTQGTLAISVGRLHAGERFEVGTPHLALRAAGPAELRIDVDPGQDSTRVTVRSGTAVVYGEDGGTQALKAGQRATFRERSLTPVRTPAFAPSDAFDRWAGARRRSDAPEVATREPDAVRRSDVAPAPPAPPAPRVAVSSSKASPKPAKTTAPKAAAKPSAAPGAVARSASPPSRPPALRTAQGDPGIARPATGQAHAGRAETQRSREVVHEEEAMRRDAERQKAMTDQWRREHEAWMRQQQAEPGERPSRPPPMGLPARRIS